MLSLIFNTNPINIHYASFYNRLTNSLCLDFGSPLKLVKMSEPIIPNDRYVKLKTRMCGICGTDLGVLGISTSFPSTLKKRKGPIFLGHEIVAEVTEIGKAVSKFKIGDRVTIGDDKNCETFGLESCCFCIEGLPVLCINRHKRKYYDNIGAGWSEYFVRHENQLFFVPDDVDDDVAVLMEPVAASLHAVLRSPPEENDNILIIGAGTIGLGIVSAIRSLGIESIKITVLGRHEFQRDEARKLGADHVVSEINMYNTLSEILDTPILGRSGNQILNKGFNYVYDCISSTTTINNGLRWLSPRGNLIIVGMSEIPKSIDFTLVSRRELNILGTHGYAHDSWENVRQHTITRCVDWVSKGRLKIDSLLTHKFPLSDYKNALKVATSHYSANGLKPEPNKTIKVAFDYSL